MVMKSRNRITTICKANHRVKKKRRKKKGVGLKTGGDGPAVTDHRLPTNQRPTPTEETNKIKNLKRRRPGEMQKLGDVAEALGVGRHDVDDLAHRPSLHRFRTQAERLAVDRRHQRGADVHADPEHHVEVLVDVDGLHHREGEERQRQPDALCRTRRRVW